MTKNYTSIVLCTYNRAHLLKRSLFCYKKQTLKDFELLILDDNSQDDTKELVESYKDEINIKYIKLEDKKPDEWRDAGAIINRGIKMTSGEYIYITHPEVMIAFDCLEQMNNILKEEPEAFVNCKTYYMTVKMQREIDTIDWQSSFYNIRKLNGFYDDDHLYDNNGEMKFFNQLSTRTHAEKEKIWHSWLFGGMTRKSWKNFGGLTEYPEWGSVDIDFMERRWESGIKTISPADVYVIHQNHDDPFGAYKPQERTFNKACEIVRERYNKKVNFLKDMEL